MTTLAVKLILVALVLAGVGLLAIQLEHYSAGRRLEEWLARTRQITTGMTEDLVVSTLGEPMERISVRTEYREHEACRRVGATKILTYRLEHRGWFGGLGLDTGWSEFFVCLDKENRVVGTNHTMVQVLRLDSHDLGTGYRLRTIAKRTSSRNAAGRSRGEADCRRARSRNRRSVRPRRRSAVI